LAQAFAQAMVAAYHCLVLIGFVVDSGGSLQNTLRVYS